MSSNISSNQEVWSSPDISGICIKIREFGKKQTLRGKRFRRRPEFDLHMARIWPSDFRTLARQWLSNGETKRWKTMLGIAGPRRTETAAELLEAMLKAGWIELTETREAGRWVPAAVEFLHLELCRQALGLTNRDLLIEQWDEASASALTDPILKNIENSLGGLKSAIGLRRRRLLTSLEQWNIEAHIGTRRNFSLFASQHTKGVHDSDWRWLENYIDLEAYGITAHIPLLYVRAPLSIRARAPELGSPPIDLNLRAVRDVIGLSPKTIEEIVEIHGDIGRWRLVENRTSFEQAAKAYGARDAVVWLPGHAPGWWRRALVHLIELVPRAALIAADPDPAGIAIARNAGQLWSERGLAWEPWCMNKAVLDALPARLPLSDADRVMLNDLIAKQLPESLQSFALAMREAGFKGEQEGVTL